MKPFDIRQVIKERVNREALEKWAKSETLPLPKYQKPVVREGKSGWYMFFRALLP